MINSYKNLILLVIKSNFLQEVPSYNNDNESPVLARLSHSGEVSESDIEAYLRVKKLLLEATRGDLNNLSEEILNVQSNVERIINNSGDNLDLDVEGVEFLSNEGDISIYAREKGENGIRVSESEQIITDENGKLGNLDYEGYSLEEALKEVDDILTALEEAEMFNTSNYHEKAKELKEAFRLKYAVYAKNDLA